MVSRHTVRRASLHRPARFRPGLLVLEDRTLPSTFLVLNLDDAGAGSLRQAILDANATPGADRIRFACDDNQSCGLEGVIALTSGQLEITDDLTLDGPGADRITVSGNHASRVFQVASGVTVFLDDLTIAHGLADHGGGIWNAGGVLTLARVLVAQNEARGAPDTAAHGGGVFNDGGSLAVEYSVFAVNVVTGGAHLSGPTTQARGGGIANRAGGVLTVSHSAFLYNRAQGGDGAPGFSGGTAWGGAIASVVDGGPMTLLHSTFESNETRGGLGGAGANGGFANGGAVVHSGNDSVALVQSCTFAGNQALAGDAGKGGNQGGVANGGAITNTGASGDATMSVSFSLFSGNRTQSGQGTGGNTSHGGAISVLSSVGNSTLEVSHTSFTGNQVRGGAALGASAGNGGQGGR